jgi:hypothetical protein
MGVGVRRRSVRGEHGHRDHGHRAGPLPGAGHDEDLQAALRAADRAGDLGAFLATADRRTASVTLSTLQQQAGNQAVAQLLAVAGGPRVRVAHPPTPAAASRPAASRPAASRPAAPSRPVAVQRYPGALPVQRGWWDDLKDGVKNAAGSVVGTAKAVGSAVASGASSAWNTAKAVGSSVASGASAAWSGVKGAASSAWSGVKGAASSAWSGAKGAASSLWGGVKRGAGAVRRKVSAAWGSMKRGALALASIPGKLKRAWTDDSPPTPDASGACPGTLVSHGGRCYDQRINGCGPADSILERVVPDSGPGGVWNFYPACANHDVCYGTPGATQRGCDDAMMTDMLAICAAHGPGAKGQACRAAAVVYHKAVAGGGARAFERAQGVSACPPLKRRLGLCSVPGLD